MVINASSTRMNLCTLLNGSLASTSKSRLTIYYNGRSQGFQVSYDKHIKEEMENNLTYHVEFRNHLRFAFNYTFVLQKTAILHQCLFLQGDSKIVFFLYPVIKNK